jgi:hypothetical protein
MPHKLHPLHHPTLRRVTAAKRAAVALLVGLLAAAPIAVLAAPEYWLLVGWSVTAVVYRPSWRIPRGPPSTCSC